MPRRAERRLGYCDFINPRTGIVLSTELLEKLDPAKGEDTFRVANYIGDTEFSEQSFASLPAAYRGFAQMIEEYAREKEAKDGDES
jgi:hypothetical protein